MAAQKITELTDYSTAITTDILPIVDVTTSTTKKITLANLATGLGGTTLGQIYAVGTLGNLLS